MRDRLFYHRCDAGRPVAVHSHGTHRISSGTGECQRESGDSAPIVSSSALPPRQRVRKTLAGPFVESETLTG